jgi:hypothetical protein
MGRIRDDFVGVVWAGGGNLFPGDAVPDGVEVGDEVLSNKPVEEPEDPVEDKSGSVVPKRKPRTTKPKE